MALAVVATASPKPVRYYRLVGTIKELLTRLDLEADALAGTVLDEWCEAAFPGLPKSGLTYSHALAAEPAVKEFASMLAIDDFLQSSYWLSSAYAMLAGEAYRHDLAMFFTPPSLTKRLLDDLEEAGVDFATRSFCDPACGGAAFLAPLAQRMRAALRKKGARAAEILEHIQQHVFGTDKDATLCGLSQHFLLMVLRKEVLATGKRPAFRIARADSLVDLVTLFGTLDVVVCNPPFRKMRAAEVARYRTSYGDVIGGQPNLYALFIALCLRLVKTGGTCALVTPTSYLSGQYFSKLRTLLITQAQVLRIGVVSHRTGVFIDVQQETALTLLRRTSGKAHEPLESKVCVVARDGAYRTVGSCVLPNSGSAWPIPRAESDVVLLRRVADLKATLATYGYVARIGSFVWNRDPRPTYTSDALARMHRGTDAVPLLWSRDIKADGSLHFGDGKKQSEEPPFIYPGAKNHASVVRRPSVVLQRVTANSQPRRLVTAAVPEGLYAKFGGFVGENHIVVLESVTDSPALSPVHMAELLASPAMDRQFRCLSGATNVSIFELEQLRLPDPDAVLRLMAQGMSVNDATTKVLTD